MINQNHTAKRKEFEISIPFTTKAISVKVEIIHPEEKRVEEIKEKLQNGESLDMEELLLLQKYDKL